MKGAPVELCRFVREAVGRLKVEKAEEEAGNVGWGALNKWEGI